MTRLPLIGLTQRLTAVEPHGERRDSLARDWLGFMKALALPWLALPNDAETALDLAARFDLGGLILTGGEDMGVYPERDETEAALLSWARETGRPAVGVCRGFQFMWQWLGGGLAPVERAAHVAVRHEIVMADGTRRMVNSYHNFAPEAGGARPMTPLARCAADGNLEMAGCGKFLGLMWHPEREPQPAAEDLIIFDFLKRQTEA
ncbi:hypothetical protein C4J81_18770 (plasmid) [Deltaproteobacteria bacterium Smac51]|nr:hypothetical protein C4J81_18770 [Deltaproteobacteria bacterium Smac51]